MRAVMCRDHLRDPVDEHLVRSQWVEHLALDGGEITAAFVALGLWLD